MTYELHEMDCRLAMSMLMDAGSVDAIVTDPPYGLSKEPDVEEVLRHWLNGDDYEHGGSGFMGKTWDSFVPGPAVWREAYRVLKPGGHLVAFFGTRTYDLGVMALRMAGFEIRDQLAWVFGQGFPKSHNISQKLSDFRCLCDGPTLPNTHARTEEISERGMRCVPETDLPEALHASAQPLEVLQQGLPEQDLRRSMPWTEPGQGLEGCEECRMERRRHAQTTEGQLFGCSICSMSAGGAADGPEGRLHHGTSLSDGENVRLSDDPNGSRQPYRSRPFEQPSEQSGALADERGSQAWRGWEICGGCGKPRVPEGLGSALKPAYEPIVLARKPIASTVAANVLRWGVGAINIDGCRVEAERQTGWSGAGSALYEGGLSREGGEARPVTGRWPANLCHDGSPEVLAEFPTTSSGKMKAGTVRAAQDGPGSVCYGTFGGRATDTDTPGDSGSAARFFKSAELGDEDWLAQNLPHVLANIADNHLSLRSLFDAFALGLAVNSDHRAEMQLNECPALSIPVTLTESRQIGAMLIGVMNSIGNAFGQESPPTKLSLSLSHAQFVADLTPIGTTLTMTDLWISSGFVDPITFSIMPTNSALGAKGYGPSAARFKYCAKASKSDRNEGLDDLPASPSAASQFRPNHAEGAANGEDGNPYGRWSPVKNTHATVKPSALMQWLVRLVTPPGGTVLDPFTGSGTTGVACAREGFNFIGCEMTSEYIPIATRRIAHAYRSRGD